MNSSPSYQRSPLVRVSKKQPCPVCSRTDWPCSFSKDGHIANCRTPNDKANRDGQTYLHFLVDRRTTPCKSAFKIYNHSQTLNALPTNRADADVRAVPRAPIEQRDAVYEAMTGRHLVLAREHDAKLLARGLDSVAIQVNGYASTPTPTYAANVARALAPMNLEGVPGFYRESGQWRMVRMDQGFFIPVRDAHGRIQGLMIRRDGASGSGKYIWFSSNPELTNDVGVIKFPHGTSSGAPVHYAKHYKLRDAQQVVITEGALKADVIAYLTGEPVIGVAGVSTFGPDFATRLKESLPSLRRVAIAYDRDLLEKREVYSALLRLTAQLERSGFTVRIRTWSPPSKGYDDYLLAQLTRREVAA